MFGLVAFALISIVILAFFLRNKFKIAVWAQLLLSAFVFLCLAFASNSAPVQAYLTGLIGLRLYNIVHFAMVLGTGHGLIVPIMLVQVVTTLIFVIACTIMFYTVAQHFAAAKKAPRQNHGNKRTVKYITKADVISSVKKYIFNCCYLC